MIALARAVRFEEVDAAGIVFFAHLVAWGHEAMERFFDQLEGGYVTLIVKRRVGLPAVKLDSSFSAPLRYGDVARIETEITHLGRRSATLRYRFVRERDGVEAAVIHHTVVTTDLDAMRSCEMPDDVRRAFQAHLR